MTDLMYYRTTTGSLNEIVLDDSLSDKSKDGLMNSRQNIINRRKLIGKSKDDLDILTGKIIEQLVSCKTHFP